MNDKENKIIKLIGTPDELDYDLRRSQKPKEVETKSKDIYEILEKHLSDMNILMETLANIASRDFTMEVGGTEGLFYESPLTAIQFATANPAAGQDIPPDQISFDTLTQTTISTTGYQRERVYDSIHRKAAKIVLSNDGTVPLYVRNSPNGSRWSREVIVFAGECKIFYNCWELRLRATVVGNISNIDNIIGGAYRLGEYYNCHLTYVKTANRTSFTAQNVAVPAAAPGINLPNILIPAGFSLSLRANVNNVGNIYISDTLANVLVATTRITLKPGDAVGLFVTNANLAVVLGTGVGQTLDILVEQ